MKKRVRRGLSLLLALCVLMSVFTGTAFAVTGTAAKQVTFQQGFTERGSISGTGFNAMANVPREGTAALNRICRSITGKRRRAYSERARTTSLYSLFLIGKIR